MRHSSFLALESGFHQQRSNWSDTSHTFLSSRLFDSVYFLRANNLQCRFTGKTEKGTAMKSLVPHDACVRSLHFEHLHVRTSDPLLPSQPLRIASHGNPTQLQLIVRRSGRWSLTHRHVSFLVYASYVLHALLCWCWCCCCPHTHSLVAAARKSPGKLHRLFAGKHASTLSDD